MKHLVRAVDDALVAGNWYAALALSLTLPDIASAIEGHRGRKKYAEWCDAWLTPSYTKEMRDRTTAEPEPKQTMGELREAFLAAIHSTDPTEREKAGQYTGANMPTKMKRVVFLSGYDVYALRCGVLHQGVDDVSAEERRGALERFAFQYPRPGSTVHCNGGNGSLQLQVDIFCRDVCAAVLNWMPSIDGDAEKIERMNQLMTIK